MLSEKDFNSSPESLLLEAIDQTIRVIEKLDLELEDRQLIRRRIVLETLAYKDVVSLLSCLNVYVFYKLYLGSVARALAEIWHELLDAQVKSL